MHLIYRNVNEAFYGLITGFSNGSIKTYATPSRAGDVLQAEGPITVTYQQPLERVLFNQARDANPFFHLFEALWMLAGRNDVEPLQHYNSKIADYSDDGQTFNGAYGYRWRHAQLPPVEEETGIRPEVDQLQVIIEHLKQQPNSRRCVLQMWNVEDDLLKIDTTKDCCCNTHVYFSIREGEERAYLDMTVCNRSNDLIWGMLGANVVHFSFLQEYVAAHLGVGVGKYNQFTNNLHVYINTNSGWDPQKYLAETKQRTMRSLPQIAYGEGALSPEQNWFLPLVHHPETFDKELPRFINNYNELWEEPFLENVARPMCRAFDYHKERNYDAALSTIDFVQSVDWRIAARNWLLVRRDRWEARQDA